MINHFPLLLHLFVYFFCHSESLEMFRNIFNLLVYGGGGEEKSTTQLRIVPPSSVQAESGNNARSGITASGHLYVFSVDHLHERVCTCAMCMHAYAVCVGGSVSE